MLRVTLLRMAAIASAAVTVLGAPVAMAQPGPLPGPAPEPTTAASPTTTLAAPQPLGPAPGPAAEPVAAPVTAPAAGPAPGPAYPGALGPAPGPAVIPAQGPTSAGSSLCPDVEVVFARGTHDTQGLGTPGDAFVGALRERLGGRTLDTYAVNYPASYDFLTTQDGANDAAAHIATLVQQCPQTKIVLGGYSQGAAVVDMLADVPPLGNRVGEIAQAPPLAQSLLPHISAVAVFGNPSTKFSLPLTGSVFGGRAIDLCKQGDPICSRGRNPFAHNDYVSAGMTDQAADFVSGLL
jgi:cutinase